MKRCPDCKTKKDISLFGKESANKDGLRTICKACNSLRALKWHNKNVDWVNLRERELHKKNPSKNNAKNKRWRDKNPEKIKEASKRNWLTRDIEKIKKSNKKWRDNNKDNVKAIYKRGYEKNKESIKKKGKKWEEKNRPKRRAIVAKRKAIKIQATPKWLTKKDFEKINSFYIYADKLTKETNIPHEVDHIIPLQCKEACGLHHWTNLQILTAEQNRAKGNKMSDIVGLFPEESHIE